LPQKRAIYNPNALAYQKPNANGRLGIAGKELELGKVYEYIIVDGLMAGKRKAELPVTNSRVFHR